MTTQTTSEDFKAGYAKGLADAAREVPHTWLDPLLSGKDALGKAPFSNSDIETLCNLVRKRIEGLQ